MPFVISAEFSSSGKEKVCEPLGFIHFSSNSTYVIDFYSLAALVNSTEVMYRIYRAFLFSLLNAKNCLHVCQVYSLLMWPLQRLRLRLRGVIARCLHLSMAL